MMWEGGGGGFEGAFMYIIMRLARMKNERIACFQCFFCFLPLLVGSGAFLLALNRLDRRSCWYIDDVGNPRRRAFSSTYRYLISYLVFEQGLDCVTSRAEEGWSLGRGKTQHSMATATSGREGPIDAPVVFHRPTWTVSLWSNGNFVLQQEKERCHNWHQTSTSLENYKNLVVASQVVSN